MPIEIWISDWVFFYKQNPTEKYNKAPVKTFVIKDVVCKRIPIKFLINEERDIQVKKNILPKILATLEDNFKIIYTKKIGITNE